MKRAPLTLGALAVAAALSLTACGSGSDADSARPEVKVEGAFIPAPASGDMAAGFFVVRNGGGADTLTSVSSAVAGDVTMHSTKDGVMTEEKSFAVPADGDLDFERGGNHLMFENLKHRPKEGDKVSVKLHFAKSGTVDVAFPVKAATYNPSSHASHSSQ
ncbi:copper chaperone PCu(A)C [Streptomyces sp. VRA16 Mangrove soil]|uniref:copper chaperone PCu(A)C n=1 Tax=Streptomyces sp. VRA16 Mangrove soil TaxID=2817434 RepID=UPI001A9D8155|nr:copper chaperone PCu(A)C [Streptomyces sp. VRA16 Mangrove soil]MBO1336719.1 copper chaperone PCu(A)C [Streptomyces sp. VRA16 Mangrove soil]